jgi:hypothetical protein
VTARPQVALATCAAWPDLDDDGPALLAALERVGIDGRPAVWDDPAVDWAAYDLAVVRSTWDYVPRCAEFLAWAATVPRLANPADVLAWNTDKRYLDELAGAGVPVVPTVFVAPGEAVRVPSYDHVVKPTVSAGSADTARFTAGADSTAYTAALLGAGRTVMVQPYQAGIDDAGETAMFFFAGQCSHAVRKGPILVPGVEDPFAVAVTPAEATPAQLAVAQSALAAVPFEAPLLYARVDVVPGADGSPLLLELELTEPSLFLDRSEGATDRFAAAVRASL